MSDPVSIAEICVGLGEVGGVSFRPWRVDDAPALVAAWADDEIARWNPVPPNPTLELAESWIESTSSQNEASVGIDVVAIHDGAIAGEVGLQIDPAQAIGEVGFWVGSTHRRNGVGRSLLTFAQALAERLELAGLVALVDPTNTAAINLLTAMGWPEIPTKSKRRAFAHRVPSNLRSWAE